VSPQLCAYPELSDANLRPPFVTTGAVLFVCVLSPSWSAWSPPQHQALPSVCRPHEWRSPALTAMRCSTWTVTVAVPEPPNAVPVIVATPAERPVPRVADEGATATEEGPSVMLVWTVTFAVPR